MAIFMFNNWTIANWSSMNKWPFPFKLTTYAIYGLLINQSIATTEAMHDAINCGRRSYKLFTTANARNPQKQIGVHHFVKTHVNVHCITNFELPNRLTTWANACINLEMTYTLDLKKFNQQNALFIRQIDWVGGNLLRARVKADAVCPRDLKSTFKFVVIPLCWFEKVVYKWLKDH